METDIQSFIYNMALGIPGLFMAIVFHEVAHGFVALKFGDPTAKTMGRLTLNPMAHIDIFGSIIVPLISVLLGGSIFGWAKPVPINPLQFKNIRQGIFWVSLAGPITNFILVIFSALAVAILLNHVPHDFYLFDPLFSIFKQSVLINTIIGTFNLIPIPPLDGQKVLTAFMSYEWQKRFDQLGQYSFFIFLFLMISGASNYIFLPPLRISQWIMGFLVQIV